MKGLNRTAIPYLDLHWSVATGCLPDKPCWKRCWARRMAVDRFHRDFTPKFHAELLDAPLRSRAPAGAVVGVAFTGDLGLMRADEILAVVGICGARRDLTFVTTTKRAGAFAAVLDMRPDATEACVTYAERFLLRPVYGLGEFPPPNVHLGFSAWDQASFDAGWRAMAPLAGAGWRVWCSLEPMIGPVDTLGTRLCRDTLPLQRPNGLAGIILGAESGPGARPLDLAWVRLVRDQCEAMGVAFAYKQGPGDGATSGHIDAGEHRPVDLPHWRGMVPVLDGCTYTQTPWGAR